MEFDLVISHGRVIDPESATDMVLNVGIKDGIIAAISKERLLGNQEIDASGFVVAPGFIDIHCHEDFIAFSRQLGEELPPPVETAGALLRTGVTTMVGGNCGMSAYPVGAYLERVREQRIPVNYLMLLGYNSLREVLGIDRYRTASPAEVQRLKEMATRGLEEGAVGISFGLQYAPGISTTEIMEMAGIAVRYGGFVAAHLRYDYPRKALEAIREMGEVAATTGVRVQISHIAANVYGTDRGRSNMEKALELLEEWEGQGLDVRADTYPYNVWATTIKSTVFDADYFREYSFSYPDIEVLSGPFSGRRCSAELFTRLRQQDQDTMVACHNAVPYEDIRKALKSPFVCVGSDGQIMKDPVTGGLSGHPRSAGTPARFLKMVRDEGLTDLVTAVRKLTLDPARRLKLSAKGRLQVGKDADITVFDFNAIVDRSKFGNNICALPPEGIKYVVVAGRLVWDEQESEMFIRGLQSQGGQNRLGNYA